DMQQGAKGDARERIDSMTEVIRVLRREHANMAALVKALEWQVAEFEAGRAPDYDVIRSAVDYFLSFPDLYHHPKEDLVFARLKVRTPDVTERIGDLRREHEALAARTREFAAGLKAVLDEANVPREAFVRWGRAFIDLQQQHMHMEETEFFPAALQHLGPDDWRELEGAMTTPDDPLFGERVGERFESLRKSILEWQEQHRRSSPGTYR
ncbi:MAG TPA: hemerythrin domain-containing protein, partial [Rhodospirillales bacterium]|nr:hemerythrin domain-containing protein [Rhodospirillales bacterium]